MRNFFTFFICLSAILTACGGSGEKVELQYNLETGKDYKMVMHTDATTTMEMLGQKMDMVMTMGSDLTYTVVSEDETGIKMSFVFNNMDMGMKMMGQEMSYSSQSQDDPIGIGAMLAAMTNKPLTTTMTKKGKVLSIEGFDELMESMASSMGEISLEQAQEMQSMIEKSYGGDSFKSNMEMAMAAFPDYPVGKGDKWETEISYNVNMPMAMKVTYEYKGVKDGYNYLTYNAVISTGDSEEFIENNGVMMRYDMSGTMSGDMLLDKATGWPYKMDLTMNMKGNTEIQPGGAMAEGMSMPIEMKMKMTFTDK